MNDTAQSAEDFFSFSTDEIITTVKTVPIDKIELPEFPFDKNAVITNSLPVNLYPFTVYETEGKYRIIDGCKRFFNAVSLKKTEIVCLVVDSSVNSRKAAYLRILMNCNRELSVFEKYHFVKWLKENCPADIYQSITSKYPFNSKESHELETLPELTNTVFESIKIGLLDLTNAADFLTLDTESQGIILDFFSKLQFSRSMQRELIEWLPEIAYRKACKITDILSSVPITETLAHKSMNQPQKVQKIRELIYEERFPLYSAAKDKWMTLSRKLNPDPAHFQFIASDSFEKNRLEMKITVKNSAEIMTILEKLKNISSDQWDKLIYPSDKL